MNKYIRFLSLCFILLVLLQSCIFNNINILGYIDPLLYIWFILLLPFETPRWMLLVLSFLIGFSVDIFSGSLGFHAATSTFTAFIRPLAIYLVSSSSDVEMNGIPHIRTLGFRWYIPYTLGLTFVHSLIYFLMEAFSFSFLHQTIFRALICTVITSILIISLEAIIFGKKRGIA